MQVWYFVWGRKGAKASCCSTRTENRYAAAVAPLSVPASQGSRSRTAGGGAEGANIGNSDEELECNHLTIR